MKISLIEKEVMDPLAESGGEIIPLAPLNSPFKKISIFDNTKPNADVILQTIASQLKEIEIIKSEKPAGAAASNNQLQKAAEGDISILALGDCGSCTTWVILDAIRLEKKGVPTICICSDKFSNFARKLANAHGINDLRIIELPHPIAGRSREEVEEKTLKIFPEIQKILDIN